MLNAEELLIAEMEASPLNSSPSKAFANRNPWIKHIVFGGIIVLALAGAYYINKPRKLNGYGKEEK